MRAMRSRSATTLATDAARDRATKSLSGYAKQWSLKALPVDLFDKRRSIAIVTLKNRTVSPVVQLFVEHLRAVAKSMFAPSGSG
jgi:DNA-binding transcriptional LysR family regulator